MRYLIVSPAGTAIKSQGAENLTKLLSPPPIIGNMGGLQGAHMRRYGRVWRWPELDRRLLRTIGRGTPFLCPGSMQLKKHGDEAKPIACRRGVP
jgi:hypothetical protein